MSQRQNDSDLYYISWLDWDLGLLYHTPKVLQLVYLCLTGNLGLQNVQGGPVTHFHTKVFVAHRWHGSLQLASDLISQVSQEIPGYPQAFQESWEFSNGLTQTHRRKVWTGPDGHRMLGGIYSVGPLCVLGVQDRSLLLGPCAGVQQPVKKTCLLGALPSFQISTKCV